MSASPRPLYWLTLATAAGLILLVILSPLLHNEEARPAGWRRLTALFARDIAVRRTAVGSALGLIVTACVFFQPPARPRSNPKSPGPPPQNVVGA
jgi:hypothetical protein